MIQSLTPAECHLCVCQPLYHELATAVLAGGDERDFAEATELCCGRQAIYVGRLTDGAGVATFLLIHLENTTLPHRVMWFYDEATREVYRIRVDVLGAW